MQSISMSHCFKASTASGMLAKPLTPTLQPPEGSGAGLVAVDKASVAGMPGLVQVVVIGDFVGVVAEREEQAAAAARKLKVSWRKPEGLPRLDDLEEALRELP